MRFKKERAEKGDSKSFFLKWGGQKEKAKQVRATSAYAFYRPGVTPVEDAPSHPERKREWASRPPVLHRLRGGFKWAGIAALILVVIWSKNKTTALLQDVAGLKLEKVSVDGSHYLSEDEIVKTAALPVGESMFKLDLNQALEKVEQMDWVDRAFIERRLPRSIVISVRERKPVALLDNGTLYGVDREGRVLSPSPALLAEDLPLVSGLPVRAEAVGTTLMAESLGPALDFFEFLGKKDPAMAQDVSEVSLSDTGSLKVTFIDGVQASFNPPVAETDLKRMAMVMSDLNEKGKHAGTMDFRYRDMVLVKTREEK